ncbi:AbiV family abortive infection protein [Megalodesulfovibrio gigas]|uniref:AbiV family abortive infection protein n=1 Tax=Megalodesulfovibrio gigas (strain ATCC 19364 / DSM 1382 / NCIMB 9332 / VKM B-1759) TaxID=1121448 RepID=T2GCI2_MEGG1|nr:AbiV family abortive infection protein [Megalodesulfovibrio gigas]AGW13836.1 hypothetical protein DGI_2067 [Megalodesulfovibrio gigas DSM 1382 = ATCC 19364]
MPDKNNKTVTDLSLSPYRGELSPEDVAKGMECVIDNAKRLANDARILFDAGRYPSSCALAILSIEEIGKLSILRRIALGGDDDSIKAIWREFSSHTDKNFMWMFLTMALSGARKLADFRKLFNRSNAKLLNNIKSMSLYSGCYGRKHWSNPHEVVDKELAIFLLKTAELLSTSNKRCPSVREVQLWIEYMQPVWNTDYESQTNALAKWHQALTEEGLAEDGKYKMDDFVKNGVVTPFGKDLSEF